MDEPKKRRLRFGLRTLLILVGACAVASLSLVNRSRIITQKERWRVQHYMTPDDVERLLGPPIKVIPIVEDGYPDGAYWQYAIERDDKKVVPHFLLFSEGHYAGWMDYPY